MSNAIAYRPAPLWRRMLAGLLDFAMVFGVSGYVIGRMTGELTDNGFSLTGVPALICIALVIGYFVVFGRFLGGTLWQRILRTRPTVIVP